MTPRRVLAAAQTVPERGDVEANLGQHLRLVDLAARRRPAVLVFPELSLTGYELELAADLAFSSNDPRLSPLVEAAAATTITLVVGAPMRLGPDLFIGAFILSPDRTIEVYTKHHLGAFSSAAGVDGVVPPAEATVFRPGDRNPLVRLDGRVAAVAICADTGRPSHAAAAAQRGAGIYLASMFVIPSELERETASLRSYAARHAMVVVVANYGGPTGGLAAAGGSAIWSETGALVAGLEESGGGVVIAAEGEGGWRGETVRLSGA